MVYGTNGLLGPRLVDFECPHEDGVPVDPLEGPNHERECHDEAEQEGENDGEHGPSPRS